MSHRPVSVVIPSIGRESLSIAVESALGQTVPPGQVIVVLDRDVAPDLPKSDAVIVLRTAGGVGPAAARQLGVESATGDVIALLDDDDTWLPEKLERQLALAPSGDEWIVSSRVCAQRANHAIEFPRRLIGSDQSVAEYLFVFTSPRFGGASLQTSTLLFPRTVAMTVPLSIAAGSVHDDPLWLMAVRKEYPRLQILQSEDVLVRYGLTDESLSRSSVDRSGEYVAWGLNHLQDEAPRIRGDYLVTSPVAAAVAGDSLRGALHATIAGFRRGRPGPGACAYALAGIARIILKRVIALVGQLRRAADR